MSPDPVPRWLCYSVLSHRGRCFRSSTHTVVVVYQKWMNWMPAGCLSRGLDSSGSGWLLNGTTTDWLTGRLILVGDNNVTSSCALTTNHLPTLPSPTPSHQPPQPSHHHCTANINDSMDNKITHKSCGRFRFLNSQAPFTYYFLPFVLTLPLPLFFLPLFRIQFPLSRTCHSWYFSD